MGMSVDKMTIALQQKVAGEEEWSRKLNSFFDPTICPLNTIKKESNPVASTCGCDHNCRPNSTNARTSVDVIQALVEKLRLREQLEEAVPA